MQVSRIIRQALGRLRAYVTAHAHAQTPASGPGGVFARGESHDALAQRRE
jgi:hypothetical protein